MNGRQSRLTRMAHVTVLPSQGVFGPTALGRLRAIQAEQQRLQGEANALLSVVLEGVGYDLAANNVRARYDVTEGKNGWVVDAVEPVAPPPNGAPQLAAPVPVPAENGTG